MYALCHVLNRQRAAARSLPLPIIEYLHEHHAALLPVVRATATSDYHTLLITDDATLYGYGHNTNHPLGHSDPARVVVPQPLCFPRAVHDCVAGGSSSMVLCQQGLLWASGWPPGMSPTVHFMRRGPVWAMPISAIRLLREVLLALLEDGRLFAIGFTTDGRPLEFLSYQWRQWPLPVPVLDVRCSKHQIAARGTTGDVYVIGHTAGAGDAEPVGRASSSLFRRLGTAGDAARLLPGKRLRIRDRRGRHWSLAAWARRGPSPA